jgi:hypothetical protein
MSTHPRFSVLSSGSSVADSTASSSTRFSLPSVTSLNTASGKQHNPNITTNAGNAGFAVGVGTGGGIGARPNIYDRNLNKTRSAEVSASAFAFLFSEMVQYTQKRVHGIADLERRWGLFDPMY